MKFFVIAGEESGDIYGARLMREIKSRVPGASFEGIGGDRMISEGLKPLYHARDMAAIGLVEIFRKIPFFRKAMRAASERMRLGGFDALILIDYPEFNFRMGRAARSFGIPVFYYVCPQLWAWRRYRVNDVRRWVDTMLVIFPFEERFYRDRGVSARFVGHPMLDEISLTDDRETLRKRLLPAEAKKLIGIMPGSRRSEVGYMLASLVETAERIHAKMPDAAFVVPLASHIPQDMAAEKIGDRGYIKTVRGNSHMVMSACDLLITKSGTSSLEGAIFGAPMIIVYRFAFTSFWLAKLLVREKYAGLPNIIAGREVAKEFLQHAFRPEAVADHAFWLLEDTARLAAAREEMELVRRQLGEKGAAGRAADVIVERVLKRKGGGD